MDDSNDSRRSRLRPSSPGRALLLGVGVLALLAVVAAVSRAHDTPGGRSGTRAAPAGVGDYLFSIFAVVMVAGALGLVYLWLTLRNVHTRRHDSQSGMIKALAFLMVFALFAALLARFHGDLRSIGFGGNGQSGGVSGGATSPLERPGEPAGPQFKWLPVLLAGGGALVALSVIGLRSLRRQHVGLVETFLLEQEFEELVEDTLADLYAERDPRRAIIAAYARVELLFRLHGLPRDPSEAPMEYLDRVLPQLRASGSALQRLTRLFEWAKFSSHEVGAAMRDEAISALVSVRDELRALRIEAAA